MMPLSLADVFFTDGDAVQNFVSGIDQSERDRQEYVHQPHPATVCSIVTT